MRSITVQRITPPAAAFLLELGRAWSAQSPKPKRSAIFLAVTAEEKGLLGSKFYARNPLVPLEKTALNLNFDMILPLGVPESIVVTGAERTAVWPAVKAAAEKNRLEIEADQGRTWASSIGRTIFQWPRRVFPHSPWQRG